MDLFSLGFVLLILAVSGLIAWVADGLGKKIGKKRLSLFGLRPKHVASLGTVAMGVIVSALTIGFIAAVNNDVRTWLRKGAGLIADNQRLGEENKVLEENNRRLGYTRENLQATKEGLETTNGQLQKDIQGLREGLSKEQILVNLERASLERVRSERGQLLAERGRLNKQVSILKLRIDERRRQYEATKGLLATAKTDLEVAKVAFKAIKEDLVSAQDKAARARKDANEALMTSYKTNLKNHDLEAEVATKQKLVEGLQRDTDARKRELDDAVRQLAQAQQSFKEVQVDLAVARQGVLDLNTVAGWQDKFLKTTTRSSRTEPLTFRKDEELARFVVPAGASEEFTRNALTSLIRSARRIAESRGAKPIHAGGQNYEAADIVDRKDPQTGEVIEAEALRGALVNAVASKSEDQVIVASSSLNAFAGEPVSLDLRVMPNPLVYRRNETVAEAQIDGGQTEDRILAQLSAFVSGRVRERAVKDRMVPRLMTSAPFGETYTFEVLNLVRDVKQKGRPVRVQAIADADIHAADNLRLEFRVR